MDEEKNYERSKDNKRYKYSETDKDNTSYYYQATSSKNNEDGKYTGHYNSCSKEDYYEL